MQIRAPLFCISSACLLLHRASLPLLQPSGWGQGKRAVLPSWDRDGGAGAGKVGGKGDGDVGRDGALVASQTRKDPASEPATSAGIFLPHLLCRN